jgi:hypothetical protein
MIKRPGKSLAPISDAARLPPVRVKLQRVNCNVSVGLERSYELELAVVTSVRFTSINVHQSPPPEGALSAMSSRAESRRQTPAASNSGPQGVPR